MKRTPLESEYIDYDGDDYIRFDADNWYVYMGQSLESVSDSTIQEAEYEAHFGKNQIMAEGSK